MDPKRTPANRRKACLPASFSSLISSRISWHSTDRPPQAVVSGAIRHRLMPPAQSAALLKTLSYVIFHDASSFAKTIMEDDIHPKQLRAARGLLNWSRGDLAAAAKTTERTIARLEDGASKPRAATADAIDKAFDKAGVMFIPENGGGRGVRLKKRGKR